MAVAPQPSPLEIVDLRLLHGRLLAPLLEEEERHWREELHWDYRPSVEMIRHHLDAHSLPGYVALWRGRVVGYCFYVFEDEKGLIGDLYVLEAFRQPPAGGLAGIATLLLEHTLETLENAPPLRRLETQLMPFGIEALEPVFAAHQFRYFPRLFMYKPLGPARADAAASVAAREAGEAEPDLGAVSGAELRLWQDDFYEPLAELILDAYAGHVDSQINDHYRTPAGALRFLKNIVLFPGCGVFQADCSLVAAEAGLPAAGRLLGAVLSSQVARGVGHITQICVQRRWQGHGLGQRLLVAALARLEAKGCRGVSLTVTAGNRAVNLYRRFGFEILKEFTAYARDLPVRQAGLR